MKHFKQTSLHSLQSRKNKKEISQTMIYLTDFKE